MISIQIPSEDARDTYAACAKLTNNSSLRAKLLLEEERVALRSQLYLTQASAEALYSLLPEDAQNVTNAELAGLYSRVFVKRRALGIYERLKSLAPFRRCPLCGQRDVKTLDHYLPREFL
jgi:hypothetical protein